MEFIWFISLLVITYAWGTYCEKKHYASIREREDALPPVPVVGFDRRQAKFDGEVASMEMVYGSVVVGADYFKYYLSNLISFFGGNIATLENVLDRGRREAVIRLKQKALTADYLVNLRYETSQIDNSKDGQNIPKVEVYAYATAVYLKK